MGPKNAGSFLLRLVFHAEIRKKLFFNTIEKCIIDDKCSNSTYLTHLVNHIVKC